MKTILIVAFALGSICIFADEVLQSQASRQGEINNQREADRKKNDLLTQRGLQGVDGQLTSLYAQRDAILKGLHNLGYDICLSSRMGSSKRLSDHLVQPRKKGRKVRPETSIVWDCHPNSKCLPPSFEKDGVRVVFPLKNEPHRYKKEFKKTQIIERLLTRREYSRPTSQRRYENPRSGGINQGTVSAQAKSFHDQFFSRTSCLEGDGLLNACELLSDDRKLSNPSLKRLKTLIDKNPWFKKRFDGELACKVADSKKAYMEKLLPVQKSIVEFETKFKKNLGGDNDGGVVCEMLDNGSERCTIVEPEPIIVMPQPEPPVQEEPGRDVADDRPKDWYTTSEVSGGDQNFSIPNSRMTCERAAQRQVEFCVSGQLKLRCSWDNDKRYCELLK